MNTPVDWLSREIDRWTSDRIITAEQANRLRALYPPAKDSRPWALIVFFGIGAVVIGLGVILLFAYNWAQIPKAGKLALVFGLLAGAHAGGLILRTQSGWRPLLGQGLSLFGTMAFGAGIWLVAQIYHINEHYPQGFLYWGLGALAMAWALRSAAQAYVALGTLTIWMSSEVSAFDSPKLWALPLLILAIAPLAWALRAVPLVAALVAASYVLLLQHGAFWGEGGGAMVALMTFASLLLALRHVLAGPDRPAGLTSVLAFFGHLGFLLGAFILSFPDAVEPVLRVDVEPWHHPLAWPVLQATLLGLALLAWAGAIRRARSSHGGGVPLEETLYPIATVLVHVLTLAPLQGAEGAVAAAFNLVVAGIGTMWIVQGCRRTRLRPVILGSLLLGAILFARYFDLFDSLAARGLAFVVFGGILFAEGFFYRKQRQTTPAEEAS